MVPLTGFLINTAFSLGASFISSLFGAGKKPWTKREVNKIEEYDTPQSEYGKPLPWVIGTVPLDGVYIGAKIPYDNRVDTYRNGATREEIETYIWYGSLGVAWCLKPSLSDNPEIKRIYFNKANYYYDGTIDFTLGPYWFPEWPSLSLNHHHGDQTSLDSKLNFTGENHIPHRGKVITTMDGLRLNNSDGGLFNQKYPGLTCEYATHTSKPFLGEAIAAILKDHGYSDDQIDTTEVDAIEITGYKTTYQTAAEKLAPLAIAFNFLCIDFGYKLKFIKEYRSAAAYYIPLNHLAASEEGQSRLQLFDEIPVELEEKLPTTIRVSYIDVNLNYQPNTVDSISIKLGYWDNIETVDLSGLALTRTEALNIANRIIQLAWLRRKIYKFSVLAKYLGIEAGDVLEIPFYDGIITQVQCDRVNQGANGVISIEAYPYDSSVLDGSVTYTAPAPYVNNSSATQGTPISLGQTNINSVDSVTNSSGTITYTPNVDYSFNLATGTVTPIIGGAIANGSNIITNWQGEETPISIVLPDPIPENPNKNTPKILTFTPSNAKIGDTITIEGSKFTGTTLLEINEVSATFTVISDILMTAIVPATTTGKIVATNVSGSGDSLASLVISAGEVDWGSITGTLSSQTDLQTALNLKANTTYVDSAVTQLINGAPADGDTLKELNDKILALQAIVDDTTADADSIIDTVTELLAVFNAYPEGVDISALIASKLNISDVVNNLTTIVSGKALDARQGGILNDLIAALTTTVNGKINTSDIVDDLTSTDATKPLSAKQGKVLSDAIPIKQKGAFGINIVSPTVATRILFTMPFTTTIINFNDIKTTAGTCTMGLTINGVNITPMSTINVTSTPQNITATSTNVGVSGNRVELVVSAISSPTNLTGTIQLECDL